MRNNHGRRTRAPRAQRSARTIMNELTPNASSHAPSGRSGDRDVPKRWLLRATRTATAVVGRNGVGGKAPGPRPASHQPGGANDQRMARDHASPTDAGEATARPRSDRPGGRRRLESRRAAGRISSHGSRRPDVRPGPLVAGSRARTTLQNRGDTYAALPRGLGPAASPVAAVALGIGRNGKRPALRIELDRDDLYVA